MAKKGAIFIKNDLIFSTVYPPPQLFQGEKGDGFLLKRKPYMATMSFKAKNSV
jgi:hypothetical protein